MARPHPAEEAAASEDSLSGGQRRVEIAVTLLQNGWDVFVRQIGLLDLIPGAWRQKLLANTVLPDEEAQNAPPPLPVPEAVRRTLEELGPTFVKLGQVLSTRADLLPANYIEELKKLQQEVTPVPWPQ